MASLYGLPSPVQTKPRLPKPTWGPPTGGTRGGGLQPSLTAHTSPLTTQYGANPAAMQRALASYAKPKRPRTAGTTPGINPNAPQPQPGATMGGGVGGYQPGPVVLPQAGGTTTTPHPAPTPTPQPTQAQLQQRQQDAINAAIAADPRYLAQNPLWAAEQNQLYARYGINPDGTWASRSTDPYSVYNTLRTQADQSTANAQASANASGALFSGANAAMVARGQDAFNRNLSDAYNSYLSQMQGITSDQNALRGTIANEFMQNHPELYGTTLPTGTLPGGQGSGVSVTDGTNTSQNGSSTITGQGTVAGTIRQNTAQSAALNRAAQNQLAVLRNQTGNSQATLTALYAYLKQHHGGTDFDPAILRMYQAYANDLRARVRSGK